jgi:hypothetical protein
MAPPALTVDDLERLAREKAQVEKHERDVRGRLESRMRKMQEEAQKYVCCISGQYPAVLFWWLRMWWVWWWVW